MTVRVFQLIGSYGNAMIGEMSAVLIGTEINGNEQFKWRNMAKLSAYKTILDILPQIIINVQESRSR